MPEPFTAQQIVIEVIVNGMRVEVAPGGVRDVIRRATEAAGQIGAPIEQWELRTTEGEVIPHSLDDDGWTLTGGTRLWLTLGVPKGFTPGAHISMSPDVLRRAVCRRDDKPTEPLNALIRATIAGLEAEIARLRRLLANEETR